MIQIHTSEYITKIILMEEKLIKEINNEVAYIWINRTDKKNAMDFDVWFGIPDLINEINENEEAKCILLLGKGDSFSAGIDIATFMGDMSLNENLSSTTSDRRKTMKLIEEMQGAFTTIANSKIPVIALAHGFCLGGATSMISACDIRLSTKEAKFSIGETKLGLVADVGILQRMPKIVSKGDVRELAFTGRHFDGIHADKIRFVNAIYESVDELYEAGRALAEEIAKNSKNIVVGTKEVLNKGEDLSTEQALDYVRLWNTSYLISEDLKEGVTAFFEKRDPDFK